ncbi:monovalent cation/H+ antiporter complex subunit F [Legionella cincinnatiensis]|uniref:Monovalent cation/H+ antiporter subunit F n=1 Tax=Legionella cincinnatiensis TaxID=28085 RepID=A0A378IGA8_9GAMM|nr:monovalent cation/H+ antiporter complex subunit F [Legionella cincinnatiensis]KTC92625.1 putative monovalent cation/H+ antiporter subunit F [Legionella cincinnatiensis]STX34239.1 putative monovalent cation/H+ antiporter subunit F [Legionella cincinnatiensis]
MNIWFIAILFMLLSLLITTVGILRGTVLNRLIFLQVSSNITTITALLLCEFYGRAAYFDVPLTMAILSFISILIFIRYLE